MSRNDIDNGLILLHRTAQIERDFPPEAEDAKAIAETAQRVFQRESSDKSWSGKSWLTSPEQRDERK